MWGIQNLRECVGGNSCQEEEEIVCHVDCYKGEEEFRLFSKKRGDITSRVSQVNTYTNTISNFGSYNTDIPIIKPCHFSFVVSHLKEKSTQFIG